MRAYRIVGGLFLLGVGFGCGRPGASECEAAVANIRKVTCTREELGGDTNTRASVQKCQAQSSKAAVKCWSEAQTQEALAACESTGK